MDFKTIKEKLNNKSTFEAIKARTKHNDIIGEWYNDLYEETGYEGYERKARALKTCCKLWDVEYYQMQGFKDILRTNHCNDRFCDNCQSINARRREDKYTPFLDAFKRHFDIYHITFTVTNVTADKLNATVNRMFSEFGYIIRLFRNNAKIKGYDFTQYGFIGAVRALEITKNVAENTFHPHFHTLFLVRKGLKLDTTGKTHLNKYSFDSVRKIVKPYYFSDFEILLQKVWRLRYDGVKVNKASIEALPLGYSVKCVKPKNYHEVFKYATKGVFKDGDIPAHGYEDFKALQATLENRRIIQGYGCLNGFKFDDEKFDFDYIETLSEVVKCFYADKIKADEEYKRLIEELRDLEPDPLKLFEKLEEIYDNLDYENIKYISRASVYELISNNE